MKKSVYIIFLLFIIYNTSLAGSKLYQPPEPIPGDQNNVPKPESNEINAFAEYFEKQIIRQIDESLDFSRQFRKISGDPKQAKNIDAFGRVPNSSWFTNRIGFTDFDIQDTQKGPDSGTGPDTSDVWIITRAKAQGVTPGFSIKDKNGTSYVIKFDPPGYSELASGAEVVSTKLFYAAGYNTPENYVVFFDPSKLKMGSKVKFTDEKGRKRFMNETDLATILQRVEVGENGKIRALASKYISGKILGPFRYRGIRKDDFNDFIPHQHRRELRGLRLLTAWLNHFDTKDGNSLDSYVTENGKSFVKHFLIDFGATLGSASHSPNTLWRGHEHDVDPGVLLGNAVTLGLYVRPWEKQDGVQYPSIGFIESELFNPIKYKPQVPNPAFEYMTANDAFWAARIIMAFTKEHLQAAIDEAHYTDPEAAAFLLKTLIERQKKIGEYCFSLVNPCDDFAIQKNGAMENVLTYKNYAIESQLESKENTSYKYRILVLPEDKCLQDWKETSNPEIPLSDCLTKIKNNINKQIAVQIQVKSEKNRLE